jgi:hypothetical protein
VPEVRLAASTRVPRTLNAMRWHRIRHGLTKTSLTKTSARAIPEESFSNSPRFHRSSWRPPRPSDPNEWRKSSDAVPRPVNVGFESE